jgi:oligopeptide transport system ATP-binding protein
MEPPFFPITATHAAATWLLHPDAPKVTPPPEIVRRQKIYQDMVAKGLDQPNNPAVKLNTPATD